MSGKASILGRQELSYLPLFFLPLCLSGKNHHSRVLEYLLFRSRYDFVLQFLAYVYEVVAVARYADD